MKKYFLLLSMFIMLPTFAEAGYWDSVTVSARFSPSSADFIKNNFLQQSQYASSLKPTHENSSGNK